MRVTASKAGPEVHVLGSLRTAATSGQEATSASLGDTARVLTLLITLGIAGCTLLVEWALISHKFGRPLSRTRQTVLRHVQEPKVLYKVKVWDVAGTWNPAQKPVVRYEDGRIHGKGRGSYWRDEAGAVHLLFQPVTGAEQHFAALVPPVESRPKANWIIGAVLAAYAFMAVVGFTIGYGLTSNSDTATANGVFGAAMGLVSVPLLVLARSVAKAARSLIRGTGDMEPRDGGRIPADDELPRQVHVGSVTTQPVPAGPVPDWVRRELQGHDDLQSTGVRKRLPRAWPPALLGVLGILATFVLDPISNSDRVSLRVSDALWVTSTVCGASGALLLVIALVLRILRGGTRREDHLP